MAQAAQDWKSDHMTHGFIEKKMTALFPKVEVKPPKAQADADEGDSGPAAIAAGARDEKSAQAQVAGLVLLGQLFVLPLEPHS